MKDDWQFLRGCVRWAVLAVLGIAVPLAAEEQTIVLRDYLRQNWTNELVTYPFVAKEGTCREGSAMLTGPRGPVAVQLSDVRVLARYGVCEVGPAQLHRRSGSLGHEPLHAALRQCAGADASTNVEDRSERDAGPGTGGDHDPPVRRASDIGRGNLCRAGGGRKRSRSRRGDAPGRRHVVRRKPDVWAGKLRGWSATMTDRGPVFARVVYRYSYQNGNSLALTVQVAAGDNTMRMETCVPKDQPNDGFDLVLSRGLPPLVFQVQDEGRQDRPCFTKGYTSGFKSEWAEIPLADYVARGSSGRPDYAAHAVGGLVRHVHADADPLKLQNTVASCKSAAWTPGRGSSRWTSWMFSIQSSNPLANSWPHKLAPLLRGPSGEVFLQINAAVGLRKWIVSDCLSMPGAASLFQYNYYKPESGFPGEAARRSAIGSTR